MLMSSNLLFSTSFYFIFIRTESFGFELILFLRFVSSKLGKSRFYIINSTDPANSIDIALIIDITHIVDTRNTIA